MDDLRNFLAQNNAFGYASPAPQQTPMSSADRYAPGLMSSAPSMGGRAAPGVLGGMGAMPGQLGGLDSREWRGFGGGGQLGSSPGFVPGGGGSIMDMIKRINPNATGRIRPDPGFYDPATGLGGPRNADGTPMTGGGGVNQMAPGYDPQMGLQKALQGLLGGLGPSSSGSSGVSLGRLAGGGFGRPGMGPGRGGY